MLIVFFVMLMIIHRLIYVNSNGYMVNSHHYASASRQTYVRSFGKTEFSQGQINKNQMGLAL